MQSIEPLMTRREFAIYMNVSEATVDKWIRDRKVAFIRTPGGSPRFWREPLPQSSSAADAGPERARP